MNLNEILGKIDSVSLTGLYVDEERARARLRSVVSAFRRQFGERDEAMLLSAPGRSEICGNHTDHNGGCVIAAAIDRDIISVAARRDDGVIRVQSEGRIGDELTVERAMSRDNFPRFKSIGLIAGVVRGFRDKGYKVGGFDAYTMTEVLSGSGLSSSAAFEVMLGNILNHLYNDGKIDNTEIARIAQFAENEYFGKPSGLMDQMAAAVGGFVFMDFADEVARILPIDFSLKDEGYRLCIVAPGGSHSELNDDFAAIPAEMRLVAGAMGRDKLSGIGTDELMAAMPELHKTLPDRALLRALHFTRECERSRAMHEALTARDMATVLKIHRASGHSSFEYLQNVYTPKQPDQGLSLALALSEVLTEGIAASIRVHGGGFAGTIQALVPEEYADTYADRMDGIFGEGATMILNVRTAGAVRLI